MSVPIYSIVGFSGSGKTTFLEKLIAELKRRNLRLGVVKHDAHRFEIDREGKDTWRFSHAGADVVAITSSEKAALIEQRELSLSDMVERIRDVDLILTEGYKLGDQPKIAIYRTASGKPLPGPDNSFFAIVTDANLDTQVPCFGLDDSAGVADLILADAQARGSERMMR
jgi:molybdopterin-guanine dinucleotide biosynthesis protein B